MTRNVGQLGLALALLTLAAAPIACSRSGADDASIRAKMVYYAMPG